MNPQTLRLIGIGIIFVAEVVVILINIPWVSLLSGIILLGVILGIVGRMFLKGQIRIRKKQEIKGGVISGAESETNRNTATVAGEKEESGPSRVTKDQGKNVQKTAPVLRFETLSAMGKGLKLLLTSRSRKEPSQGPVKTAETGSKMGTKSAEKQPPSFSSLKAEAASPVMKKLEPSPFSPLEKDMVLDSDLIMSSKASAAKGSGEVLQIDADLDGLDMMPLESDLSNLDISLDEEAPILIDDEEEDEVTQILATNKEEDDFTLPGSELPVEQDFSGLDGLNLDIEDLNQQKGMKKPVEVPLVPPTERSPLSAAAKAGTFPAAPKSKIERNVQDETMMSFASASSGDDDLISSLRTDISSVKRDVNSSLIRDLKDVRVQIKDIEEDLSAILSIQKKKS